MKSFMHTQLRSTIPGVKSNITNSLVTATQPKKLNSSVNRVEAPGCPSLVPFISLCPEVTVVRSQFPASLTGLTTQICICDGYFYVSAWFYYRSWLFNLGVAVKEFHTCGSHLPGVDFK